MTVLQTRFDLWRRSRLSGVLADIGAFMSYGVRRFVRDRMTQAAGALTYTTLLALVPLLAIAFSIFSAFPAFEAVQDRLRELVFDNLVPEVGQDVRGYLESFTENASRLTAVGVVALGVTAILLLSTIESTLNTIWRVERQRPMMIRLLMFWTVLTFGPILLGASFSITSDAFSTAREWAGESYAYVPAAGEGGWAYLQRPVAALIQAIAFTALFYIVPARSVRLRDAAIGGVISGVAFEILKWGFKIYLEAFPTYQTIYGAVAVFPIFLIWLYLSWTVIIFGAVFAAAFPEWWRSRDPVLQVSMTPAMRLEAAVALLAILAKQARVGGAVSQDALAAALPLDARDGIVETLRNKGYLVTTDDDGIAVARDLRSATLADLAHDLGLTLGLEEPAAVEGANTERSTQQPVDHADLEVASGRLPSLLRALRRAEDEILDRSLAEIVDQAPVGAMAAAPGNGVEDGQRRAILSFPAGLQGEAD